MLKVCKLGAVAMLAAALLLSVTSANAAGLVTSENTELFTITFGIENQTPSVASVTPSDFLTTAFAEGYDYSSFAQIAWAGSFEIPGISYRFFNVTLQNLFYLEDGSTLTVKYSDFKASTDSVKTGLTTGDVSIILDGIGTTATSGERLTLIMYGTTEVQPAATPEPATMAVFGLGIAGLAVARRFRRR